MSDLLVASNITLNLQRPNSNVVIYAKQYDMISRVINASLVSGSEVWDPPAGCEIVVMYTKPDGKMGVYDIADGYPEYSDQKTYEIGDRVMHNGYIYSCQVAILVPEAWTAGHWNFISVATPAVAKTGTGQIRITLAEQALNVEGNVHVEISFYQSSTRLTTLSFTISVEKGVPNDDALKSDNYFNILSSMIQNLLGASSYPPQIDPTTRNWIVWNADKLPPGPEVTDYSSVGPQGETGPMNDIFATDVYYAQGDSGTVPPETGWSTSFPETRPGKWTWVRRSVQYDSGDTITDEYSVYQGQNGAGAPGSQIPLKDNATPQVGTSLGFAHEDHVHPIVTPADIGALSLEDMAYNMYGSVLELGESVIGAAEISTIYGNMPDGSILYCPMNEFATTERPSGSVDGVIEILRIDSVTGFIELHSKTGNLDYRMHVGSNGPTGTWWSVSNYITSILSDYFNKSASDARYYTQTQVKNLFNSYFSNSNVDLANVAVNAGAVADVKIKHTLANYWPIAVTRMDATGTNSGSVLITDIHLASASAGACEVYGKARNFGGNNYKNTVASRVLWRRIY